MTTKIPPPGSSIAYPIKGKYKQPSPELKARQYEGCVWSGGVDGEGFPYLTAKVYATEDNKPLSDLLWAHREPSVTYTHMSRGLVAWEWNLRVKDFAWIRKCLSDHT